MVFMDTKRHAMALLAVVLSAIMMSAQAAPTTAISCNGCTLAQEEQAALAMPGLEVRFVYNLPSHRVRKFKVVLEANDLNGTGTPGRSPTDQLGGLAAKPVASAPSVDSQASRVLYELDVDVDMAAVFQAMVEIHQTEPMFMTKSWRENIGVVQPPHGPEFTPRDVTWGSTTGSSHFNNFMNNVRGILGNEGHCAGSGVNQYLCEYIHGVRLAAGWSVVLTPRGPEVGISLSDMPAHTEVVFCDTHLDCVEVGVSVTASGVQVSFQRGYEMMTQANLPVGPEPPTRLDYAGPHARHGAERTGRDILRRFNSVRPLEVRGPPECWEAYLSCAWVLETGRILGCSITCMTP